MSAKQTYTLAKLAELLSASLVGDPELVIHGVNSLEAAQSHELSLFYRDSYRDALQATSAGVVILKADNQALCQTNKLIVADPYLAYAKAAKLFEYQAEHVLGVHSTAIVGRDCQIDPTASIAAYCVIGDNVIIGADCRLEPHVSVEDGAVLGERTWLKTKVSVAHHVKIGSDVIIHQSAVIGSDGFGNARDRSGRWLKLPQLGSVIIEDDVEIGANTAIDRGTIQDTIIRRGARLDNLIQIAHNVIIGENTAIAACCGVAGSTVIGKNCLIAGHTGITGHIQIADQVILTGMSMVTKSITESGIYSSGTGLLPNQLWKRTVVRLRQLDRVLKEWQTKFKEL